MRIRVLVQELAVFAILLSGFSWTSAQQDVSKIQSLATIRDAGSYSFPAKIAADRLGNLYVLDSALSNVFVVNAMWRGAQAAPVCSPRTPVRASDLSVEGGGGIWILDSMASKIIKLDRTCKTQKSFIARHPALALQVNAGGEIVILTSAGGSLFDLYDQNGTLLRSFGQRISYGNPIADGELSNGHKVADRAGGFYFSFNYPPLVQHYGRDGKLLAEFKPAPDVYIAPPNISSQQKGTQLTLRSNYQILVLDVTLDERGRLIFLISGKSRYEAIAQGSQNLLVTSSAGRVLRKVTIEDANFHRLAAGHGVLYLLRNRDGLRLDKYALP